MIVTLRRGGGRSWLAVLLASLVALVVAAVLLLDGGVPSSAGPGELTATSLEPPVATPAPTRSAANERSTTAADDRPRWSSRAATSAPTTTQPDAPRRLVVPRLDLDMPVVPTGVADGQMELPERPSEIGWYRYGPRPGDQVGSSVLAGHLDSDKYGIGPLAKLRRLEPGDRVSVENDQGLQTYEVRQVVQISKQTVPLAEVFTRSGPATLRIVTCGGPYDRSRGGYLDNLVVTAVPL